MLADLELRRIDDEKREERRRIRENLPRGWAEAIAPDGQPYYYNEKTRETTWDPPPPDLPIPAGWVEYMSRSRGVPFYFNESTGETLWERPTHTTHNTTHSQSRKTSLESAPMVQQQEQE